MPCWSVQDAELKRMEAEAEEHADDDVVDGGKPAAADDGHTEL